MKLFIPLAALLTGMVMSANTCSEKSGSAGATAGPSGAKWVLASLNGEAVRMPEGVETPFLSIDSLGTNVTGYAGCNRVFGTMRIWGDSIAFPGLAATRMYCQETQQTEDRFLEALNLARTWSVKDGDLILLGGKELAVFHRSEK